jgi:hypothetical protein
MYHLERAKPLSRFSSEQVALLTKLNRADTAHLAGLTRIIVPDRWDSDELLYSPMPRTAPSLLSEKKGVIVDIAAQVFGAYEHGLLVRWGPISSGDRHHQTPSGTYHLNWRARVRVSSEDSTWVMPWYFNFSNERGLALHQYALPGRPASHGCARMLAIDAKWLFSWGEGRTFDTDASDVSQPGTLVLVQGIYEFGSPPVWLQPEWLARGVSMPMNESASRR